MRLAAPHPTVSDQGSQAGLRRSAEALAFWYKFKITCFLYELIRPRINNVVRKKQEVKYDIFKFVCWMNILIMNRILIRPYFQISIQVFYFP